MQHGPIFIGHPIPRIKANDIGKIGERLVYFARIVICNGAIIVGVQMCWRDFDKGIKIRDRFFPILVAQVDCAAIVKGQRVIEAWFHFNDLGKV